jgi:hypothetical protein
MGKGANKDLLTNSGTASTQSATLSGQGNGIGNYLAPQLESEANDPQGYTPQQQAYMNTASQQSLGGSTAGVTGEADLTAARTRNAGGFQGAIGSGSRSAARQLSTNALGIQKSQADLQQAQKQQALSSLQQLYGVDESTALGYLNSSDSALNEENQSHPMRNDISAGFQDAEEASQAFKNVVNGITGGGNSGG